MNGSNLPPGVSSNDIPGDRPEDVEWDRLFDVISACDLTAWEARARWDSQSDLLAALKRLVGNPTCKNARAESIRVITKAEGGLR